VNARRRRAVLDFGATLLVAGIVCSIIVWMALVATAADRIGLDAAARLLIW
jgi:hypothetical protein